VLDGPITAVVIRERRTADHHRQTSLILNRLEFG